MIVWILRDAEPLPIDPNSPRLMRAGMLARQLAERGHQVVWFTSTFDHYQKRHRSQEPGPHDWIENCRIELVRGIGYGSNSSPRRLLHNYLVGRAMFQRGMAIFGESAARPDVIVGDLPMPESALAGVNLGKVLGVPSVVSIRDLWPDFFANFLTGVTRSLAAPAIAHIDRVVRKSCGEADHLVGISQSYLEWGAEKAGREIGEQDAIFPLGYQPPKTVLDEESLRSLQEKGVDLGKRLAVFIGSWGGTYDLGLVIDAAKKLQKHDDIQFVLAGDGDQRAAIDRATSDVANIVTPGWLNRGEIAALLEQSTVALAPYPDNAPQGLPNKVFEYMSAGLWQVSTLGREATELLDSNTLGLSVTAGDRDGFAAAILEGSHAMERDGTRERIRRYFEQNFSAEKVYGEYIAWLERVADRDTFTSGT